MIKGDAVVLVKEDGTKDDNGFYYVDQFKMDDGEVIMVIGGMAEELIYMPANRVMSSSSSDQQKTLNVLVDIAGSIKHLTERINLLIPKCQDCGSDLQCGPEGFECDGPEDDDEEEDEEEEPKLN